MKTRAMPPLPSGARPAQPRVGETRPDGQHPRPPGRLLQPRSPSSPAPVGDGVRTDGHGICPAHGRRWGALPAMMSTTGAGAGPADHRGGEHPMGGADGLGPVAVTGPDHPDHPAWARLVDQLGWYDRKSVAAQRAFRRVKIAQVVLAAGVPVVAAVRGPAWVTAVLGSAVVVLEAVQQLYQWQTNWVLYRSTAEALKHEKSLFLSAAGPYAAPARPRVLAERIEGLISQEHAKWTQGREPAEHEPR